MPQRGRSKEGENWIRRTTRNLIRVTGSKGVLGDSVTKTIRADDDAYRLYRCADATTRLGTREPVRTWPRRGRRDGADRDPRRNSFHVHELLFSLELDTNTPDVRFKTSEAGGR